jgi:hypothetical protein
MITLKDEQKMKNAIPEQGWRHRLRHGYVKLQTLEFRFPLLQEGIDAFLEIVSKCMLS